jgi:hypothetical protein
MRIRRLIRSSATGFAAAAEGCSPAGRFEGERPAHRFGSDHLGKFEIVRRIDLLECRLRRRRLRQHHFIGEFEHLAVRQGRAYLLRSGRLIEAVQ